MFFVQSKFLDTNKVISYQEGCDIFSLFVCRQMNQSELHLEKKTSGKEVHLAVCELISGTMIALLFIIVFHIYHYIENLG